MLDRCRLVLVAAIAGVRQARTTMPAGRDAVGHAQPHGRGSRQPDRHDLSVRRRPGCAGLRRGLLGVRPLPRRGPCHSMWTDDHEPPTPTRQWKPGATVEYTRTMFIPKVPVRRADAGRARPLFRRVGSESCRWPARTRGDAVDPGRRVQYAAAARTTVRRLSRRLARDGGRGERPGSNGSGRKKRRTLSFRNPKRDVSFPPPARSAGAGVHRASAGRDPTGGRGRRHLQPAGGPSRTAARSR